VTGTQAGWAGVAVLLVAALVLEVRARRGPGGATAAQVLGAAMRTHLGRATVLLAWVWLGVHFLAR
jgi:uncharacterized protein DUF6186